MAVPNQRVRRALWLALIITAFDSNTGFAEAVTRQLRLHPGESEEVRFPPGTDLSISRRGIVDVFHLGEGRWQVTALHGGFAVIDAHDAATGETRWPRLFVDVPSAGASATTHEHYGANVPVPLWLCQYPGVSCDKTAGIVSGTVDSYKWLARARAACEGASGCYFAVHLTAPALAAWLSDLRLALGEEYSVSATAAGLPVAEVYCGHNGKPGRQDEADALAFHAVTNGEVLLRCREQSTRLRYRLSARIFLVEDGAARDLGFDANAALKLATPPASASGGLLAQLRALTTERRAEMLGAPVVRLTPNEEVQLASGGEFQVLERVVHDGQAAAVEQVSSWKQHGLSLRVTAWPVTDKRIRLAYAMTFKSRLGASANNLTVNELKSEVDLTSGEPVMVGVLDLRANGHSLGEVPWLCAVPFIGPFFRLTGNESANSRLLLWLHIAEDDQRLDLNSTWEVEKP